MNWKKKFDKTIKVGDIVYYIEGGFQHKYGRVISLEQYHDEKRCRCKGWLPKLQDVKDGKTREYDTYMPLDDCTKVSE